MRVVIAVVRDVKGNFHVPYVGDNCEKAIEAVKNPKIKDAMAGAVFRNATPFFRRKYEVTSETQKPSASKEAGE